MTDRPFRPHPKPIVKPKQGVAPSRSSGVNPELASALAIEALSYLASEPERLDRFLALTGLDHGSIRTAAQEPGFLAAVLDHITADESLLLTFAQMAGHPPETVAAARETLAGPGLWATP